jgi:hypothetical protein
MKNLGSSTLQAKVRRKAKVATNNQGMQAYKCMEISFHYNSMC